MEITYNEKVKNMRLFIGIKTNCEQGLAALQNELRKMGSGNFTHPENLHITLKFLGELPPAKLGAIRRAMNSVSAKPFALKVMGAHLFNKSGIAAARIGGDVNALTALHAQLEAALVQQGFDREHRAYRPHVTLARKFRPKPGADIERVPFSPLPFIAGEIVLFESKRVDGKLVYEPLRARALR